MSHAPDTPPGGGEPRNTAAWICRRNIETFRGRLAKAREAEQRALLADLLAMEELRLLQIAAAQDRGG